MGRPKKNIQSKSSKRSNQKPPTTEREALYVKRTMSRGIFEEAKRAERFGPHPGFVSIKLRLSLYNPMNQKEERLPGKGLDLLVSSAEEVDDMLRVIERSLKDWISGVSKY